ncbi:hypothetical protein [Halobiforma nitratireducens]|uniref:Uncharacterized protein n=1 Tax=Halobiforma nitratireducens JCM 10879 TaxID=1227454 RepID=M0LAA4_9EURY|nr:hypothetical protein [Halobiforma nitratireducens]EMA30023.1 hypothetical protein C446_16867 [Halobiforma nitratireducens JCM 10879]
MPSINSPRVAPSVLVANVAIPTSLIVLVLLLGGLLTGGIVFLILILFRRRSSRSGERTDQ